MYLYVPNSLHQRTSAYNRVRIGKVQNSGLVYIVHNEENKVQCEFGAQRVQIEINK